MGNGDGKICTVTVRLKDEHFIKIKPSLDALKSSGRQYPAVVMACMIEGEFIFKRNPVDIINFREKWKPTELDTTRKDFRCTKSFDSHFKSVAHKFNVDLNSFIIASIHRSLSFLVENPELVESIHRDWLESQFASCMSAGNGPQQICMSARMSGKKQGV